MNWVAAALANMALMAGVVAAIIWIATREW